MERILPTRLVDVGYGMETPHVKLRLSSDLAPDTQYLTLSHCWGTKKFTTLQQGNLEAFCSEVPEHALSKTFKDAIKVARELRFRYLWIDSLCITQDDRGDWHREASLS